MMRYALILAILLFAGPPQAVPADLESTYNSLKEAVSQKDAAQVKQLALGILETTVPQLALPAPTDAAEKEEWSKRSAWYRDVQNFAEYALYSTAAQAPPETCLDLLRVLEQHSPKGKYMDMAYPHYFQALTKTGSADKIPQVAEAALKNLPENEDLLMYMAETALAKKDGAKALSYAEKLVGILNKHPRPEEIPEADWQRKRGAALGRGYFIAGMIYSERQQHFQANRSLRAALPYIKGNDAMMGPAAFALGVANFTLGTMANNKAQVMEAVKFSDQAATIKGSHQEQAWRNAQAMKDRARTMR